MIKFEDLHVGQTVYVNYGRYDGADQNGWLEVLVNTLIGDREPNLGRTLVEITSPWLECGWEIEDVEDLFPAPDFNVTYEMVDVVKRLPDNRTYEFGIGDINNADDPYYDSRQAIKTGQRKMILLKKCDCGHTVPRIHVMSASRGTACPDCYDRMSE